MSGHTVRCRSRYSSSRSLRTLSRKQTRVITWSEVVGVDVARIEDRGRAQDDLSVGADRLLAQLPGGEGLALLAGDLPGGDRRGGVGGQVAEVGRVPELEVLDRAVLDELA